MRVPREKEESGEEPHHSEDGGEACDDENSSSEGGDGSNEDDEVDVCGGAIKCPTVGCKRKCKAECLHKMCFLCCYEVESETWCPAHVTEKMKKMEEDRYIEEGLAGNKRRKQFDHFEDRFYQPRQTVVIFCLRDFLRYKVHSGDIFIQYEREDRQKQLRKRRAYASSGIELGSSNGSGSTYSSAAVEARQKACKEKAKIRYDKVKAMWATKMALGSSSSPKKSQSKVSR
jgi:hypothetical protein